MENIGETIVDLMAYHTRIIVDDKIIDNEKLKWRPESNGGIELTLNEIADQINTMGIIIYVWVESGLSGRIFLYNNHDDNKWYEHGTTRGYA
jgi:hypothetical protein